MSSSEYNPAYFPCDNKKCTILKGMEQTITESPETSQRLKTFYCLLLCNRALGFFLITLVLIWIFQYRGGLLTNDFNWHPLFMILGMVLVYSRGMLFYRTERTIGMPRLKVMYARIMIGCLLFTIIGLVAGYEKFELMGVDQSVSYPYTLHSWIGLTSVILFFSHCIVDFFSYLYAENNQYLQATYMRFHVYLAMANFIGAVATCLLGFNEITMLLMNKGGDCQSENTMIWFIYSTLITFGGLSVYLVSRDFYKRLERPEDNDLLTKTVLLKHLLCVPWSFHECSYSFRVLFARTHSPPSLTSSDSWIPPAETP